MVTVDTNIVFYALTNESKALRAKQVLIEADFLSVQVLNEYAWSARRKLHRPWGEIERDLEILRDAVTDIYPVLPVSNFEALRIADRYQLNFFDALMIAVALNNRAQILYSEDMQNGLVIDNALTIIDPFREPL